MGRLWGRMNFKQKYKTLCIGWNIPPNNVPVFQTWFFKEHFIKNGTLDVNEAESCRQQLIAVREGYVS